MNRFGLITTVTTITTTEQRTVRYQIKVKIIKALNVRHYFIVQRLKLSVNLAHFCILLQHLLHGLQKDLV